MTEHFRGASLGPVLMEVSLEGIKIFPVMGWRMQQARTDGKYRQRRQSQTSVWQKGAEFLGELEVLSQKRKSNRKSESNWEALCAILRSLDFVLARWFQAERWHDSICILDG